MKKNLPILCLVLLIFSCSDVKENDNNNEELDQLRVELDSLKQINREHQNDTKNQIATFLTFQKEDAEQAMNFYVELFDNSKIISLKRWDKQGPGKEGTI